MLSGLYKLPKPIIAALFIGGAIALILIESPPHTFCDTQVNHFKETQKGFIYDDKKDFHENKSALRRKKKICEQENSFGSCYDYFSYLKKILKDLRLLSNECKTQIFADSKVKKTFEEALTLITALAWRKELLSGQISKFNWLTRTNLALFCQIKEKYILEYSQNNYQKLESQILDLLPSDTKNKKLILKWSILSESCIKYR